ncbi:MAG: hypothetical protein A2782_02180 [Candidatus Blackburnbacteria bacterium RIFCSPHIGHO2_01_FULL_43_15b]|uniref:Uncharacterized protein n=1 Tax=Candidatus Blackburnbacteria bacterium RIFCSPHIGHO2_01_FULL_43_15b TaxID=1797513 RepID=A0A1G1V067_9BACT|nr:MAG: hypothetical protein A2782_02180 [Candidatus Blackburnbacteria bacterium RIFCSPHIGHO2_01_FULL_43_15b]
MDKLTSLEVFTFTLKRSPWVTNKTIPDIQVFYHFPKTHVRVDLVLRFGAWLSFASGPPAGISR